MRKIRPIYTFIFSQLLVHFISAQNPELIKDISSFGGSQPASLTLFKDLVYFSASEFSMNGPAINSIWKTDGTREGTVKIKTCNPVYSDNKPFVKTNNHFYFQSLDNTGYDFWISDGSSEGTVRFKEVLDEPKMKFGQFISFKDRLVFSANNGLTDAIYITDGTKSGTLKIRNFFNSNPDYIIPGSFQVFDDFLYFYYTDSTGFTEFWETTGTIESTRKLNPSKSFGSLTAMDFKKYKDKILFRTLTDLYLINKDSIITMGKLASGSCLNISEQVHIFNDLIFINGENEELLISDGTVNGTKKVLNINACRFIELNNKLFFTSSWRLWTTDGTVSGTKELAKSFNYNIAHQGISIISYNNKIFFNGYHPNIGYQLFSYDPNTDSIIISKNLYPIDLNPDRFLIVQDKLYFFGSNPDYFNDPENQSELALWRTDGSTGNTIFTQNKALFGRPYEVNFIASIDSILFFSKSGQDFWYTKGGQLNAQRIKPDGAELYYTPRTTIFINYKSNFIFRGNFTDKDMNDELWMLRLNNITTLLYSARKENLNIYPNPAENNIKIDGLNEVSFYNVEIIGLTGQSFGNYFNYINNQALNISFLKEGFYVLKINGANKESIVKKFAVFKRN